MDSELEQEVPSPGSDEAAKAGCLCARMDNRHGRGAYSDKGKPVFWITEGCPLHHTQHEETDQTQT